MKRGRIGQQISQQAARALSPYQDRINTRRLQDRDQRAQTSFKPEKSSPDTRDSTAKKRIMRPTSEWDEFVCKFSPQQAVCPKEPHCDQVGRPTAKWRRSLERQRFQAGLWAGGGQGPGRRVHLPCTYPVGHSRGLSKDGRLDRSTCARAASHGPR